MRCFLYKPGNKKTPEGLSLQREISKLPHIIFAFSNTRNLIFSTASIKILNFVIVNRWKSNFNLWTKFNIFIIVQEPNNDESQITMFMYIYICFPDCDRPGKYEDRILWYGEG